MLPTTVTGRLGRLALASALGLAPTPLTGAAGSAASPLDARLAHARHQLSAVVEEYNQIRSELAATRAQLTDLTPRLEPMRRALEVQRGKVGAIAAGAYRVAAAYRVGVLLTFDDPHQFTDRMVVVTRLADNQQKAVAHLDQANQHYRRAQQALAALAAVQRKQQAQLAAKRRHVEGEVARLRGLLHTAPPRPRHLAGGDSGSDAPTAPPAGLRGSVEQVLRFAYNRLGAPYRWGGDGDGGFDCSGFTKASWAAGGRALPHSAARQRAAARHVDRAGLRPGDLVFYYDDLSHVAIYVGGDRVIHAPTFGQRIRVDAMTFAPIHSYGRP